MKSRALSALFFVFWIIMRQNVIAQEPRERKATSAPAETKNQPLALADENEMEDWLIQGDQTENHLVELGVDQKIAEAFVSGATMALSFRIGRSREPD